MFSWLSALCLKGRKAVKSFSGSDTSDCLSEADICCSLQALSTSWGSECKEVSLLQSTAPGTLQEICIGVVSQHVSHLDMSYLAHDLVQRVFDELASSGRLSEEGLARFPDLDLDSAVLRGVARGVRNNWIDSLSRCSRLRSLDLSRCALVTDPGIASLRPTSEHLERLKLNYCVQISDRALANLSGMSRLKQLELEGCENLTSHGLAELAGLTQLSRLSLNQCIHVKGGMKSLAGLLQLRSLDLGWCLGLDDAEVAQLVPLTGLTSLVLSSTKVSSVGLSSLRGLAGLQQLDLHSCALVASDALSAVAGSMTALTRLDVGHCRGVVDQGLSQLAALSRLRHLEVAYTTASDVGLMALSCLTALTHLGLENCPVTDEGLKAIRGMSELEFLNLSDTGVTDGTLTWLGAACPQLRSLNLSDTRVTGGAAKGMPLLPHLTHLNLDSGSVSSEAMKWVGQLVGLKSLDLFGARVSDAGVALLTRLSALERLDLCGGSVTDVGCLHLAHLQSLTCLNLGTNSHITDNGVPHLYRNLPLLEILNLNYTSVGARSIPGIAKLKALRSLSLCQTLVPDMAIGSLRLVCPDLFVKHSCKAPGSH